MKNIRKIICLQGFTLIELMIAIIILGILVTVSIPQFARSVERAKCAQATNILKTMRTAALSYFSDNQTFAGATAAALENQIGARFYSTDAAANGPGNENSAWYYTVAAATASRIQLRASRRDGRFAALFITLTDDIAANEKELWAGTYPWQDPGGW